MSERTTKWGYRKRTRYKRKGKHLCLKDRTGFCSPFLMLRRNVFGVLHILKNFSWTKEQRTKKNFEQIFTCFQKCTIVVEHVCCVKFYLHACFHQFQYLDSFLFFHSPSSNSFPLHHFIQCLETV